MSTSAPTGRNLGEHPAGSLPEVFAVGDYWRSVWDNGNKGDWHVVCAMFDDGAAIANLHNHQVTEHDDGTITASPSILVTKGRSGQQWHGYIERGVLRTA